MTQPLQLSMLMSGEEKSKPTAVRARSKSAATKVNTNPQCQRILELLTRYSEHTLCQGWVPLPDILSLFIANYRARISELRRAGYPIELREEWVDGQRHTAYRLVK
jgi:hypothetical protein